MSDDKHLLIGQALGQVYRRANKTESYVTVPPAFMITDSDGAVWTLGFKERVHHSQKEFNVLRNDVDTGEFAKIIEYQMGVVRIYGWYGCKRLSRNRRFMI